jgi:hypothetical protein
MKMQETCGGAKGRQQNRSNIFKNTKRGAMEKFTRLGMARATLVACLLVVYAAYSEAVTHVRQNNKDSPAPTVMKRISNKDVPVVSPTTSNVPVVSPTTSNVPVVPPTTSNVPVVPPTNSNVPVDKPPTTSEQNPSQNPFEGGQKRFVSGGKSYDDMTPKEQTQYIREIRKKMHHKFRLLRKRQKKSASLHYCERAKL